MLIALLHSMQLFSRH